MVVAENEGIFIITTLLDSAFAVAAQPLIKVKIEDASQIL